MAAVHLEVLELTCAIACISGNPKARQRARGRAVARRSLPGCVNQTGLTMCMLAVRFEALPHNQAGGAGKKSRCGAEAVGVVVLEVLLQVKPELVNARAPKRRSCPCAWRVCGR